ncbi:Excinuclease ABC subunit C [hydrothermal vent metagenome]|uniref:Excinuclease ABC subunit C n=1 Tax=hydrothermal vent metagenome TaxID=652676 RepID=A0A3B0TSM6_9ZZZZ
MKYPAANKNIDHLKSLIAGIPDCPGIYQYFDDNRRVIYIGKAKNLKKRVSSYFNRIHSHRKTALLVRNIADIKYMVVDTEEDALLLENNLIKKHQPRYNVRLKDDKTFPWICIKKEPFPRVFKTRNVVRDGSLYFGPYTSVLAVNTLLGLFKKTYKLRNCNYNLSAKNIDSKKYKVCLEYHIGNCLGPCEGLQDEDSYNKSIDEIKNILKGDISGVIFYLKKLMKDFSDKCQYEDAQKIKVKLQSLERFQNKSTVVSAKVTNVDVFSIEEDEKYAFVNYLKVIEGAIIQTYTIEIKKSLGEDKKDLLPMAIVEIRQKIYSNANEIIVPFNPGVEMKGINFHIPKIGEKKKLLGLSQRNAKYYRLEKQKQKLLIKPKNNTDRILKTIKKDLRLTELPKRIECFDNSNLQGANPVASCVVFKNTKPLKREYRHFNIKTVEGANDFASMEEVVFRRYKRLIEEELPLPQLIIVDGGKGQLSSAIKALERLNLRGGITVIGIAKRLEEIYFPGDSLPLYLDKNSETLKIIQQLRNEAHRFGISFHRQKRSKTFITSELENIKGIGTETIQKLFLKYKSLNRVKELSIDELSQVIGQSKAKLVFYYFENE